MMHGVAIRADQVRPGDRLCLAFGEQEVRVAGATPSTHNGQPCILLDTLARGRRAQHYLGLEHTCFRLEDSDA